MVKNGTTIPDQIQPDSREHVPFPIVVPCLGASLALQEKAHRRKPGASQSMGQRIKRFDFVSRDLLQVGFESHVMCSLGLGLESLIAASDGERGSLCVSQGDFSSRELKGSKPHLKSKKPLKRKENCIFAYPSPWIKTLEKNPWMERALLLPFKAHRKKLIKKSNPLPKLFLRPPSPLE
ncbi:hypothetical protein ACH5RR_029447 [Cinchona calisaya]|uniref:Uncharacterized protein n=1 Tax=Cinchona calisaya TaxID=153742 RepID=A0ABD2YT43_9GENT